jgi:hypothetical protein
MAWLGYHREIYPSDALFGWASMGTVLNIRRTGHLDDSGPGIVTRNLPIYKMSSNTQQSLWHHMDMSRAMAPESSLSETTKPMHTKPTHTIITLKYPHRRE